MKRIHTCTIGTMAGKLSVGKLRRIVPQMVMVAVGEERVLLEIVA